MHGDPSTIDFSTRQEFKIGPLNSIPPHSSCPRPPPLRPHPHPDIVSFNTLLACHLGTADLAEDRRLFTTMHPRDLASYNTMLSGLSRIGALDSAHNLFDEMPRKNSVSWEAMVSGFTCAGDLPRGRNSLIAGGEAPNWKDVILWTAMVSGCMHAETVEKAEDMWDRGPSTRNLFPKSKYPI